MATWSELSRDSLQAAKMLLEAGHLRSSVSRSYYAAYCAVASELTRRGVRFRRGWNNPPHEQLTALIRNGLALAPNSRRQRDGYWWVPIRPSAQPPKMYEYYEALAEVEATLEENEQLDIQLVPTVPEEAPPTPKDASPASGKDLAPDAQPRDKSVRRFRDE